jgi:1-acyl-sn-glycerol-3-phosphate acyltransferase
MENDSFHKIRPYHNSEVSEAIQRVLEEDGFRGFLAKFLFPNQLETGIEIVSKIKTIKEFQDIVSSKFFNLIIRQTIKEFKINGLQNIDPQKRYLFISTHRDIVLDSALLQMALYNNHIETTRTAIGNNLVPSELLGEIAKLNKMFLVIRDGSNREMIESSSILSSYIRKSINEDHESVWIAQRNGRTKDGDDKTQQGLLKMMAQSTKQSLIVGLQDLNIVPISISYEYEPCDSLKAREIVLSRKNAYVKKPGEDFNSINTGIMQHKGFVEINIGKPISDLLDNIESCRPANDMLKDITQLIDSEIYTNYKLWKNNYIAADMLSSKPEYSNYYSIEDFDKFSDYINKHVDNTDVVKEEFRDVLLHIYANPVYNKAKIL